jgi:hypothetical protein
MTEFEEATQMLGEPCDHTVAHESGLPFLWSYWEGEKTAVVQLCEETIIKHNPSFQQVTPEQVRVLGGGALLDFFDTIPASCKKWGPPQRSDLIRWWLVWKFGGVWIDSDYICLAPLDMLEVVADVDLVGCYNPKHKKGFGQHMLGSPFGGKAGSPFIEKCFRHCYAHLCRLRRGERVKYGVTSVGLLSRICKNAMEKGGYNIDRRLHWKYHRILWKHVVHGFGQPGGSWQLEYNHLWNPNAITYHLTNVITDKYKDMTRGQLLATRNLLGFLFNRALGLPGPQSMMGRSFEVIQRLPTDRPTIGAEVGVFRGRNARGVLQQRPQLTLHLVDPWGDNGNEERWRESLDARQKEPIEQRSKHYEFAKTKLHFAGSRAIIHRQLSVDAAKGVDNLSLDIVFIDAEHTYGGTQEDINAWWPKVRVNGWLGGHDYDDRWKGTQRAVDEFVAKVGLTLELGRDSTWFVKKETK